MSTRNFEFHKSRKRAWMAKTLGQNIVRSYQDNAHNSIGGEPRLYVSDGTTKHKLKSWWIDINDLQDLIQDTQQELQSLEQGSLSGIRIYPALQTANKDAQSVNPYHTLVFVGTVLNTQNGAHDNILLDEVQEFVEPCPDNCNTNANTELGM